MKLNNHPFIELLNKTDPYYFKYTNLESLKTLRDFLTNEVPDEKFNLSFWRKNLNVQPGQPNDSAWTVTSYDLKNECGTVACMLGWAAAIEEFRERGLQYDLNLGEVKFNDLYGTVAAAEFFNIPTPISNQLLMPEHYGFGRNTKNRDEEITKSHAIERLQILIDHVEKCQNVQITHSDDAN